jgi:tetratricopeptide (TPR) repeat protein
MRKIYGLSLVLVWMCRAQDGPPTTKEIENIQAGLLSDLRGIAETVPAVSPKISSDRVPAGSVSVTRLRHKSNRNAQKHLSRGFDFHKTGNSFRAAAEFEKTIAADPLLADAYVGLGVEYTALERYAEAEAAFRRGITLDPDDWGAYQDLGILKYSRGDFGEAETSARRALELSKGDAHAQFLLGVLLCRREETRADGLHHLQQAARSIPEANQMLMSLRTHDP